MTEREEKTKITVICWKCDHKFSFLMGMPTEERMVYLDVYVTRGA